LPWDTIREYHPDKTPAAGLDGRKREIMAAFTRHPAALTEHEHVTDPVLDEDVQQRVDEILDPSTGMVSTEEIAFLLDDPDLGRGTDPQKVQIGGRTFYSSPKSPQRAKVRRFETGQAEMMLLLKLRQHLRRVAQHIDRLGLDTLFEVSPYFNAE